MEPTGTYVRIGGPEGLTYLEEGRGVGELGRGARRWIRPAAGAAVLLAAALVTVWAMATNQSPLQMLRMVDDDVWTPDLCTPRSVPYVEVEDMTLDEKIGQMTQVDQLAVTPSAGNGDDITKYFIGSVLSGGGGAPKWGTTAADWAKLVDHFQAKASRTRLQIPMLYGIDAVHGHNNVDGATIFPHHIGLGATDNPEIVRRVGAAAAREVAATGIRWAFSPAVSVCRDPRWGRCYESFSESTALVQKMTTEVDGWQARATDPTDPAYNVPGDVLVAATAKHFIGDGGTQGGKDEGNTVVSEAELRRVHLPPYRDAIARGVQTVMISYSSWNGLKMHANHYLVTKVLKGELGFQGVVVSDWAAIQQIPGDWAHQVRTSINAGLDMIMVPTTYKEFITTLKEEVLAGRVPMSRIDDAVRRVLNLKKALGLFENACAPREMLHVVGSAEHRAVGRQAVRESLVLLKNAKRDTGASMFPLPLSGANILVVGSHADNIGLQCGGWTIQWQGASGNITKGTTVLQGIREAAAAGHAGSVTYVEQPSGKEKADYAVVVVGEQPYAEFMGDDQALQLDANSQAAIQAVCGRMLCVVVLISGRPLQINYLLPDVDAFVAAWLPGTEGNGIADSLFGEDDFHGRLPITWFPDTVELPMTADNSHYAPLFPFGFGLDKRGKQLPLMSVGRRDSVDMV